MGGQEDMPPLFGTLTYMDPFQKICRLENIDHFVEPRGDIEYNRLKRALEEQDRLQLSLFAQSFQNFPGERPAFIVFKSEIAEDLEQADWTGRFVDRLGLYHYYRNNAGIPRRFALMEYTVAEVIEQAREKGISRCFAVPTVMESPNNPAFFPAPRSARCGNIVDLRDRNPYLPSIREYLHIRFDYSWNHLIRLGGGIQPTCRILSLRDIVILIYSGWKDDARNKREPKYDRFSNLG